MYDIIIVGGGPAGYSVALYAGRFNLNALVLAEEKKGTINLGHPVENFPGAGITTGEKLMERMENQVNKFEAEIKEEKVKKIKRTDDKFKVFTEDNKYDSKSIVIATGMEKRKLKVPGIEEFENKGISYCASCDGPLLQDEVVAVVGGGDSAAKEALLLTEYAKKVYIIYRGKEIHPEPINKKRVMKKVKEGKIEIINNTNIKEVKGNQMVTHVILDNEYNGSNRLEVKGVFIEIGGTPGSKLAKDLGVKVNEKGFIKTDKESKTNAKGVFAAGDVTNSSWKQAILAAAQGSYAAFSAFNYLKSKK